MAAQEKVKVGAKPWVMMITVWVASIMAPLAQFKVTPLSQFLMGEYGFDIATFGLLMSWMSLIGIILAFPAAFITGKMGPKNSILLCLVFILAGTAVGAVAPSTEVLFASRVLEGVGLGLMGITAPSAVAIWFPPSRRGFPMGLWSAWVPVGIVLALNTSPRIAGMYGVHAVWWAALIVTAVVTVLFALIYRLPDDVPADAFVVKGSAREVVELSKTANIWVLAIAFFSFHIVGTVMLNTYYPTYLAGTYDIPMVAASQMTSYHTMLCIVTNPLGGLLFEKTRRPKLLITLGLLILTVGAAIAYIPDINVDLFFICFTALGIGLIAGCCRAFSVELLMGKDPIMATPVAQAILTFAQRACDCFAPMIFGAILAGGMVWSNTLYFAIPMLVVSMVLVLFLLKWKDGTPAPKMVRPGEAPKPEAE